MMLTRPLAAAALLLAAPPALAWGHQAHEAIDRAALAALPDDGPVFLRNDADYIGASATLPDKWRSASEPFAKIEEDPNHGWFREQFTFLKPIPRSRYAFILALYREQQRLTRTDPAAATRMNVRWAGTLPYAIMEQYGQLVAEMRLLRAARVKGDAKAAGFLERNCAFAVVRLGHYVGDGAQPLHDSVNSDGWRGPNPHGYTTSGRIHGDFESRYVTAIGLTADDVRRHMPAADPLAGDLFEQVLGFLDRAGDRMEDVYRLEKRGALRDPGDETARALVYEQAGAGAAMLRNLILRAWHQSGQSADPGVDPLNFADPSFDEETGSVPPAMENVGKKAK